MASSAALLESATQTFICYFSPGKKSHTLLSFTSDNLNVNLFSVIFEICYLLLVLVGGGGWPRSTNQLLGLPLLAGGWWMGGIGDSLNR